jgi:hypothetical protein
MKYTAKIVLFIGLQLVIIGLAFLTAWQNSNPGDREQLEFYRSEIEFTRDTLTMLRIERLRSFQSLVESLQLNGDITNAVTKLNQFIDNEIAISSDLGPREFSGLQWPNGEKEFNVLLRIAEYRLNHPVDYKYPPVFYMRKAPKNLKEVLQCRDRRKSDPKWKPPQTNDETLIQ